MTVTAAAVERLARSLQGTWLKGKYRVDKLLGYGGAACVFAATHRNGHRVAIKLLHPSVATDESSRSRFLREGYLANKVEHRGAVHVLDDDVLDDGAVFVVMELLQGDTLDDLADKNGGALSAKLACRATFQLLDVLGAAHDRGIVHRDIKPQNLFWTSDGVLKVLDFGLARLRLPGSVVLTQSGEVFGTPAYMAPEQAIGDMENVGAASDQWSAAATFFTLATGKFVHDARTPTEMIVLTATKPARSIRDVDPTLPVKIGNVVDRALRFRMEERWPHVRDFQRALKLAYEAEYGGSLSMPTLAPVSSSSFPGPDAPRSRLSGQGAWIAGITAVVVATLGVLTVRATRSAEVAAPGAPVNAIASEPGSSASSASPPTERTIGPADLTPSAEVGSSAEPATTFGAGAPARPSAGAGRPSGTPEPSSPPRRRAATKPDPWSAQ